MRTKWDNTRKTLKKCWHRASTQEILAGNSDGKYHSDNAVYVYVYMTNNIEDYSFVYSVSVLIPTWDNKPTLTWTVYHFPTCGSPFWCLAFFVAFYHRTVLHGMCEWYKLLICCDHVLLKSCLEKKKNEITPLAYQTSDHHLDM